jgi:hypothetical protein
VTPPPPYAPAVGDALELVKEKKGKPTECVIFLAATYCKWDESIMVFVDSKFKEVLPSPKKETNFSVNIETQSLGKNEARQIFVMPGSKKLSVNGIQWRKNYPLLEKIFKANGYTIVNSIDKSQQLVKVSFGMKDLDEAKFKRYLNLVAYDSSEFKKSKKEVEMWKSNVSSIGSTRDFEKVYPILLGITSELVSDAGKLNKSLIVSDSNLNVQAIKHFLAQ